MGLQMASEKVKLAWVDFETNAPETFRQLWNQQDFADVTLATEDGHQVLAHKIILSSSSNFFRNVLLRNPHKNPLLYLQGVQHNELLEVLKYIYLGQSDVEMEAVEAFLSLGNQLQIKGLIDESNHDEEESSNWEEPSSEEINVYNYLHLQLEKQPNSKVQEGPTYKQKQDEDVKITKDEVSNKNNHQPKNDKEEEDLKIDKNFAVSLKFDPLELIDENTELKKLECQICRQVFKMERDYKRHISSPHNVHCDECEETFSGKYWLYRHKKYVHAEVMYHCNACDKQYKRKSGLKEHKAIVHDKIMFPCKLCDFVGRRKDFLDQHFQSIHCGDPFTCSECDFTSVLRVTLSEHQKKSHGRLFCNCDICD